VVKVWRERGRSGYLICRFTMVALDAGPVAGYAHPEASAADPGIEPSGADTPDRRAATVQRLVRSVQVAEYVKKLHDHTCQACGTRLAIGSRAYSEGAHIRGLGRPHDCPDVPANMLCLCPNCHVLFDNGALLIGDDLGITVSGDIIGVLRVHDSHILDREHLAYHRSVHM
jgi:putative restriction endonuclease